MTSHVPLGDPKHGGALFLLPREIRDEIYRLLVKGSYRDTECFYRYSGKGGWGLKVVRPDFAVLQVSKSVGREATEILYSESVFRFVVTTWFYPGKLLSPDPNRMKRLAPMIQNVILDVRHFDPPDTFSETNMGMAVQNFGGLDITRRSLLVRMFHCSEPWLENQRLPRICQHLKAFVGFRAVTLEMWPADQWPSLSPNNSNPVHAKRAIEIREIVAQISQMVAEELEPVWGPTLSDVRFDTGNAPHPGKFSRLGLIGYLEFGSNKHSVENQVAKEDQVQ